MYLSLCLAGAAVVVALVLIAVSVVFYRRVPKHARLGLLLAVMSIFFALLSQPAVYE
jgi:hypothetical protein